jgi:dipeptidyl aminopeptidase/acylaminoacyl peptidase
VIEIDVATGKARNLIEEKSSTFINSYLPIKPHYLEGTQEILWSSEQDGWNHLYLTDAKTGTIKQQVTKGSWVVRGIDKVDEKERQIWFRASGMNPDQDPYLIHFYRINFDGSGLVALTAGDGLHSLQYSPDRKYIIDTYSRVDLPPVHELRLVASGALVCELEKADASALLETGWKMPEPFHTKGRDGKTDIWGVVCRPNNLDSSKCYPVLDDIYAGPQDSFVPKTWGRASYLQTLAELGFIVVQIDGMGTMNRSKAFHDVCWKNLADAGLPDHILWLQELARRYPYIDLDRVGIFGTSAGGQNSTGAMLFHPEFYKAAVSSCGCHDNRIDKYNWNEQWMGYPVGPHYAAQSNITNAHKLKGKLMLIVGEQDTNVPPESTYRLVDALIKAKKDFEFILVPGMDHSDGGPYGERRRRDFFVRHLHGVEPPDRNGP